jgi:hypothetical protein
MDTALGFNTRDTGKRIVAIAKDHVGSTPGSSIGSRVEATRT